MSGEDMGLWEKATLGRPLEEREHTSMVPDGKCKEASAGTGKHPLTKLRHTSPHDITSLL